MIAKTARPNLHMSRCSKQSFDTENVSSLMKTREGKDFHEFGPLLSVFNVRDQNP